LRWLNRNHPNTQEACEAASRIVTDATCAAEIISRIRLLFKKAPEPMLVDINEVIREYSRDGCSLYTTRPGNTPSQSSTTLAQDISHVMGDGVQLQQVLTNLIVNSIEAMKDVEDGTREVDIKSLQADKQQLMVSVSDTGVGLPRSTPGTTQDLRCVLYHRAAWDRHGTSD
jgi:C4-dicarboxylate-specific signal transduction histidine kinase